MACNKASLTIFCNWLITWHTCKAPCCNPIETVLAKLFYSNLWLWVEHLPLMGWSAFIRDVRVQILIWFQTFLLFIKPIIRLLMHWKAHLFRHLRLFQTYSHRHSHTPVLCQCYAFFLNISFPLLHVLQACNGLPEVGWSPVRGAHCTVPYMLTCTYVGEILMIHRVEEVVIWLWWRKGRTATFISLKTSVACTPTNTVPTRWTYSISMSSVTQLYLSNIKAVS